MRARVLSLAVDHLYYPSPVLPKRRPFLVFFAIVAVVAAAFVTTSPALAADDADKTARLVYLRGRGAESCPDETALREAVAARLGYDPFTPWARDTLFTEIEHEGDAFVARVKLVSAENVVRGDRTLRSKLSCEDLVPTLGLTISLAIDPLGQRQKPDGLPPSEQPVTSLPPIEEPSTTPPNTGERHPIKPASADRLIPSFVLGAAGSVGSAPSPAFGALAGGGVRFGHLSALLEGRFDLPASTEATGGGRVSSAIYAGAIALCGHVGAFFGCPRATLGVISAKGLEIAQNQSSTAFWAEAGVRLGYEFKLGPQVALRAQLDSNVIFTRYTLRIDAEKVFEHPVVDAALGLVVVAYLD